MRSSRLFSKLFFAYAGLNLAATATFVVLVLGRQEGQVIEQLKDRLHDSAVLVRNHVVDRLPAGQTEELQASVRRWGAEIGTRITLVGMDGVVLADSERGDLTLVRAMDNHRQRPELMQARSRGEGSSERTSPTLGKPMLYYALRAERDGEPIGFVRTAVPMTAVRRQVAAVERLIWFVAALVSVAVLAITYFVVARMVRPITTLTEAAEGIAAGDYRRRVQVSSRDEIGALGESFNRMSEQLSSRESQLRESNRRLAAVLGGMAEGVVAVDDRGRVVLANAAAEELLDFSSEEAEGRPLEETVRNPTLQCAVDAARATQRPSRFDMEVGQSDQRVIAVNVALLEGEPSPRVVLVLHDVTELRRLESLRQEFVANVSHELKTPLTSIKAYAETLSRGAIRDADNSLRFVHRIEEQAARLHQLILDLISLARIESKQQAFDIVAVRIAEVAQSCLDDHRAAARARGVALASNTESPDLQVRADEEGLKQIVDNLVDNAVKYTPEGGHVSLSWRAEDSTAMIEVRDTGIGIAAEHLPRVFERFFRVDKARSRELGGTGLGLSIVKHLTQSFGGSVSVTSRLGEGSTFTVKLPLV